MQVITVDKKVSNFKAKVVLEVSARYEIEVRVAADSDDSADEMIDKVVSDMQDKMDDEYVAKLMPAGIGDMTLDRESVVANMFNEWPEEM